MIRSIALLFLFIATALCVPAVHAANWAHKDSDIAVDPDVRYGTLENGMRYALMEHREPRDQISLRLHIAAGSLQEAENQRGLAHFLEHMAFNGSKHFPDVEALIPQMQRLGIAFGAHANAYTSYDETVYMLDLPNGKDDVLDLAFMVMRDFCDGLLIETEEIEKERGVVQSELESRDSVDRRLFEQQFTFLLPDHLASQRMPIGLEEVIMNAPRERFLEFYEDYYIPSRMTFIAVGDFEIDAFEQIIRKTFASMEAIDPVTPDLEMGKIPEGFGFQTAAFVDEEVSQDELSLGAIRPYAFEPDTVANRTKRMPLSIANSILSRRFSILSKKEGAPISGGSASYFNWLNSIESIEVNVSPEAGKWEQAISVMEQELRRALEHGFTETEVEEIRAARLNAYEEAAERAPTRQSAGLASGIMGAIHDKRVFSHPEENLRINRARLMTISAEECHQAFKEAWAETDLSLMLTTKSATDGIEARLADIYESSREVAVEAPEEEDEIVFAYTDFGPAGEIAEERYIEDLDFTQYVLSNGVRVNLKETDFKKNSILLKANFGSGILTQPQDKIGLQVVASTVLNQGGLGDHSRDDLTRILAGKNTSFSYGIAEDSFVIGGTSTAEDLELQLQLMTAALIDPGYRDEALRTLHKQVPALTSELKHTMGGAMSELQEWLHGGDGRFAKLQPERLLEYDIEDVQAWIEPDLMHSYLELSIVGDFQTEQTLPLILDTFGTLPERRSELPRHEAKRGLALPDFPAAQSYSFESKIDKAAAVVCWHCQAQAETDIKQTRRINILSKILGDRLRKTLREELGSTYSPRARFSSSRVFGTAYLSGTSIATAAETAEINAMMHEIGQELADKGASQDELNRALTPILESLPKSLRENGHWLNVIIARSQARPYQLDWARERESDYAAITLAEINTLAKAYLQSENAATITVQSVPPAVAE
ncbi:MAG: insulinase family protein [Verrucomicrobiota bacterium]